MKSTNFRLLPFGLLLLGLTPLIAQEARMVITNDTVSVGDMEPIQVNVIAFGIAEAASIEASIEWDTTQLQYVSSEAMNLPGASIGDAMVDSGYVTFIALDGSLRFGVADSTTVATLTFARKNDVAGSTVVAFVGDSIQSSSITDTIVITGMGDAVATAWTSGRVVIAAVTSIPVIAEDERLTIHPNPITETSRMVISLQYASAATLEVLSTNGRLISSRKLQIRPGEVVERLPGATFPRSGAYIVRLTTDRERFTRKVVRQ